jgi:IS5 family transposase
VLHAKKDKVRLKAHRELLSLAHRVRGYAQQAITALKGFGGAGLDQTERRVLRGEKVPAGDKVVSFFECQTDVIVKGGRDPRYGHKPRLCGNLGRHNQKTGLGTS